MKKLLLFATLLLAIACSSNSNKQTVREFKISDIVSTKEIVSYDAIKSRIKEVKFSGPEGMLLNPRSVLINETGIYIYNSGRGVDPSVLRFDTNGKFLNRVAINGKAENEFKYVDGIFFDTNNNICIQDYENLLTFSPEGEYLGSENRKQTLKTDSKGPIPSGNMARMTTSDVNGNLYDSYFVLIGNEVASLTVVDKNRDTVLVAPNPLKYEFKRTLYIYYPNRNVLNCGNEIIFHQQYVDTVYTVNLDSKRLDIKYIFNNPNPITLDEFPKIGDIISKRTVLHDFTEDEKYIYVQIRVDEDVELYLIDKKDYKYAKADFNLNNSDDDELSFYPKFETQDKYIFYYDVKDKPEPTMLIMDKF